MPKFRKTATRYSYNSKRDNIFGSFGERSGFNSRRDNTFGLFGERNG